ncbi:MAG: MupG family TIM beta-alpha barrel fold protein [Clostridia bacterium]
MSRLGISIYPEHSTLEKDKAYIKTAAKYGFTRIFTCLLSVEGKTPAEIKTEFKELIDYAHEFNMEVVLDVAPFVFDNLGITYDDLSFFHEIGADGVRLDEGFDSLKEALMTYNPFNLKIEINSSFGNGYLANIVSHHPKKENLITCFNFYPQKYTGISFEHFKKCCDDVQALNLKNAAFVSSQVEGTYGPWPVNEGLCTLEMHRELPIDVQVRHLFATGLIDDVIIANAYASEQEMQEIARCKAGELAFKIDYEYEITEAERKIIYDHPHFVRGDVSEYMMRSTMPRVTYKDASIEPRNTRDLKRGDVVLVNNDYSRYKGELHIVMKDMPNDGRKNVVGRIPENEIILLDYLKPWRAFSFVK